jgi:hypothetical protein
MKWTTIKKFVARPARQDLLTPSMTYVLLTVSVIIYTNGYSANAQMMTNNQSGFANLSTSLSQAIDIAQQSIGNNSYAIAAFGQNVDGRIVYSIILATGGTDFYDVTIDADNGDLLSSEKLSKQVLEKRHLEHSQRVLAEPHLTNNTFVH